MAEQPSTPVTLPNSKTQDPTPLTTEMVHREMTHLEKLFEAKLNDVHNELGCRLVGVVDKLEARLDAMDKALDIVNEYPTEVERAVKQLKDLHEEKFTGIYLLLKERDLRSNLLAEAQKEARDKSEASLTRQVESIDAQIATVSRVLDSKIDDIKTRLQVVEGRM